MKMSLRIRLLMIVALPLIGMIWVSGWNTVEKLLQARNMDQLQALVAVTTRVGALIHELQKERGMSAGYLGSKGASFSRELPAQRQESDKRRQELASELAGFDLAGYGPELADLLAKSQKMLEELNTRREHITAQTIPAPEAIGYYSNTIGALLALAGQAALHSHDQEIARAAMAYKAFLEAKERAGIERALLSNTFGADRFSPPIMLRFVSNATEQDTWYGLFKQYATAAQARFAADTIRGPAADAVAEMKKYALDHLNAESLGRDARQWFAAATERIDLMKAVEDRLAGDLAGAAREVGRTATLIAWFYGLTLLVSVGVIVWVVRRITAGILGQIGGEPEAAVEIAHAIAEGKFDQRFELRAGDDSSILASMSRMQQELRSRIEKEREIAAENLRIRIALDNVSTGVMIADAQRNIIYANKAVRAVLKEIEPDIRQRVPDFDADKLVGGNIDAFHQRPEHQAQLLATLAQSHIAQLQIGERHLTVTANPVITDAGERIGSVAEWRDRTLETRAQGEIKGLLDAAVKGDFSRRIEVTDKEGFFRDMALGMNQLMGVVLEALDDIARVLGALARGDLSQRIDAGYEGTLAQLKDDVNLTIDQLRQMVTRIKEATDAINTAAKEIAAGNQDLSRRTEEQASSLEETASSMEELNSTVRNNAENATAAAELAKSSNAAAIRGGEMVGRVVDTMNGIQASSQKIADIVGVIDSIAFQTNILALNAAVEAARAGEQGRGFAVVASEVRNLAQRSAEAAKEIKALIDESVGKVEGGVRLVRDTGDTIQEVVAAFQQLAQLVNSIAEASREQASGIAQVSSAVSQMDEATQQNAALVEQAAAAAESLEEQASGLAQVVGQFSLDGKAVSFGSARGGVDFDAIIQAHLQWKHKLQQCLEGKGEPLDADGVSRDDKCAMGQWLYSEGKALYGGDAQFEELRANHAAFHRCAGQVIRLFQQGDKEAAATLLRDEFAAQSALTVGQIRAMKMRHGHRPAVSPVTAAVPAPARAAPTRLVNPASAKRPSAPAPLTDEEAWTEF